MKPKNKKKRLAIRQKDYEATIQRILKVQGHALGWHKPHSLKH